MTVTDDAPVLETQTSDVGTKYESRALAGSPFNAQGGRHIERFVYDITPSAQGDPYLAVIAGGQGFTKEVLIDGTSQNASIQGDSIEAERAWRRLRKSTLKPVGSLRSAVFPTAVS